MASKREIDKINKAIVKYFNNTDYCADAIAEQIIFCNEPKPIKYNTFVDIVMKVITPNGIESPNIFNSDVKPSLVNNICKNKFNYISYNSDHENNAVEISALAIYTSLMDMYMTSKAKICIYTDRQNNDKLIRDCISVFEINYKCTFPNIDILTINDYTKLPNYDYVIADITVEAEQFLNIQSYSNYIILINDYTEPWFESHFKKYKIPYANIPDKEKNNWRDLFSIK